WTHASPRELHAWLASALGRGATADPEVRAAALGAAALAAANQGERAQARTYARESLVLARERNDKRQIEWALRVLSFDEPDLDERRRLLDECDSLLRELGYDAGLGWVTHLRGLTFLEEGRFDAASDTCKEAAEIFRRLGRRWEAANAEVAAAYGLLRGGHDREARGLLERGLTTGVELESDSLIHESLVGFAAHRVETDAAAAARLLGAADVIAEDVGL